MRIDLPLCSFKYCRYCFDGNCTKETEYARCEYRTLAELRNSIGDDYDLDRLKELVQADREGKCVVLPCKIGSKLYRTSMRKMQVYEVSVSREYFHDSKNNATLFAVQIFENGKKSTSYECFKEKDIGKTVFLTREEAEAALERMEG